MTVRGFVRKLLLLLLPSLSCSVWGQAVLNGSTLQTTGLTNLNIGANSSTFITVTTGGNVGIGTTTPGYVLQVVGAAGIGAAAYFYTSDSRLKKDVETLNGLDSVLKLRGVKFVWKNNNEEDVGLIAQEVEKVLPQVVRTNPVDGIKSVKYGNLISPMVEAIKELFLQLSEESRSAKRRMDLLEDEIFKLKSDISVLRADNSCRQVACTCIANLKELAP